MHVYVSVNTMSVSESYGASKSKSNVSSGGGHNRSKAYLQCPYPTCHSNSGFVSEEPRVFFSSPCACRAHLIKDHGLSATIQYETRFTKDCNSPEELAGEVPADPVRFSVYDDSKVFDDCLVCQLCKDTAIADALKGLERKIPLFTSQVGHERHFRKRRPHQPSVTWGQVREEIKIKGVQNLIELEIKSNKPLCDFVLNKYKKMGSRMPMPCK